MKWLRTTVALSLLWMCALTPAQQIVLFGNSPSWVLSGASVDLDFANNRVFGCGDGFTNCVSVTRSGGNATNLLPTSASGFAYTTYAANTLRIDSTGLLVEESRTNQLLNSTAPATQTTGALAATAQTLWVNGSGSAVLSNGSATGCTGTATQGSPVTFTPTAGTCTVTKVGALNAFQLEAGSFGTSLIVTAGATATRSADVAFATGPLLTVAKSSSISFVVKFNTSTFAPDPTILAGEPAATPGVDVPATGLTRVWNGSANLATANAITAGVNNTVGLAGNASSRSLVTNGSTVATAATTVGNGSLTVLNLGNDNGGLGGKPINGYIIRFTAFNQKVSDPQLQGFTK